MLTERPSDLSALRACATITTCPPTPRSLLSGVLQLLPRSPFQISLLVPGLPAFWVPPRCIVLFRLHSWRPLRFLRLLLGGGKQCLPSIQGKTTSLVVTSQTPGFERMRALRSLDGGWNCAGVVPMRVMDKIKVNPPPRRGRGGEGMLVEKT